MLVLKESTLLKTSARHDVQTLHSAAHKSIHVFRTGVAASSTALSTDSQQRGDLPDVTPAANNKSGSLSLGYH